MRRGVKKRYRGYRAGFKSSNGTYLWRRDLQESSERSEEFGVRGEVNTGNSGER